MTDSPWANLCAPHPDLEDLRRLRQRGGERLRAYTKIVQGWPKLRDLAQRFDKNLY